jgi:nitrogen regulatory protein PII
MKCNSNSTDFEVLCVIVNYNLGSKILRYAKQFGMTGGTIFLGKGTIKNSILEFLELAESRKEIVLMAAEKDKVDTALEALNKKFRFYKPNHGIAFSVSLTSIIDAHYSNNYQKNEESRGVNNPMYNVIFTVVDRGKAEFVVDAANKAGSRGATIINARGSGIHETSKVFAMEIEPEKEVVLIISPSNLTDAITSSIKDELKIDKPGNGIIFVQDVNKTLGLY